MDIQRFDLPDGQWADLHRRPSHGQLKVIEKMTRKAIADEEWLSTQDALVITLVDKWLVRDSDGRDLPLSREGINEAPHQVIHLLAEELNKVTEASQAPNPQAPEKPRPKRG